MKQIEYRSIKIWLTTYRKLRLLAALVSAPMLTVFDQLVTRELARVQQEEEAGKVAL